MTPEQGGASATAASASNAVPGQLHAWWPGIVLVLLVMLVTYPALAGDPALQAIVVTAAAGCLLAGLPRLGSLMPAVVATAVLGEFIWFERFDDSPGAAFAVTAAAAGLAIASSLLARRSAQLVAAIAVATEQLEAARRLNLVEETLAGGDRVNVVVRDIARSLRYDRPLAVVVVRVDNFELLGRQLDAPALVHIQVELARVVERLAREADSKVARNGDILLGLPETDIHGARVLGERIRLSFGSRQIIGADEVALTASVGAAAFPIHGSDVSILLEQAEANLVVAHGMGGNRTVVEPVVEA